MVIECPIHKVAKNDIIGDNECQSCDFYNDCLFDMTSDMGDEIMDVAKKYITEIKDTIKGYTVKKLREDIGEKYNKN